METTITKSSFTLDGETYFKGFSKGEKWNGFEVPYFEYDETIRLLEYMINEGGIVSYSFDKASNEIVILDEYSHPDTIHAAKINDKSVWSIGGCSWVWEK